jgi:flagellar M-ring protein FliF
MVSSQTTQDSSSTTRSEGIPGTASNLPETAPRPTSGGNGTSRKTENVNYQTSHTVKRTVLPQGAIKRLSVSVLLDQEAHWEGTGAAAKRVMMPPSPERLKVIHDLAAATGLNTERGDQLIVESLPFESTLNLDPPAPQDASVPEGKKPSVVEKFKGEPKLVIGAAAIFAVILACAFFVFYRLVKRSAGKNAQVRALPALPEGSGGTGAEATQLARAGEQDSWTPSSSAAGSLPALAAGRIEVLTKHLREAAQKDAEICAGVLRGWLREEST